MEIRTLRNKNYKTAQWMGGSTSQIYIYPEAAGYEDRNFSFRLSRATTQKNCSYFTKLPEYKRVLMVLSGSITLRHEGHYTKYLRPFEQDCFMGSWNTVGFGLAEDFNLMLGEGAEGSLAAVTLPKGEKDRLYRLEGGFNTGTVLLYAMDSWMEIETSVGSVRLEKGDSLLLKELDQAEEIRLRPALHAKSDGHLIIAAVNMGGVANEQ